MEKLEDHITGKKQRSATTDLQSSLKKEVSFIQRGKKISVGTFERELPMGTVDSHVDRHRLRVSANLHCLQGGKQSAGETETEKLFASKEAEAEAKKEYVKTFTPSEVPKVPDISKEVQSHKVVGPTPEQIIDIKTAIINSQTLEEVGRLEQALKSGQLPSDLHISDDNMASTTVHEKDNKMDKDGLAEANDESKNDDGDDQRKKKENGDGDHKENDNGDRKENNDGDQEMNDDAD